MPIVLQVITTLEGLQVTREQLETTRLGKFINHFRRRTTNESLARRSKNLLRKWRDNVLPESRAQPNTKPNVPLNDNFSSAKLVTSSGYEPDYAGKANGSKIFNAKITPPLSANMNFVSAHNNSSNCSFSNTIGKSTSVQDNNNPTSFENLINQSDNFGRQSAILNSTFDDRSNNPMLSRVSSSTKRTTISTPNGLNKLDQSSYQSNSLPKFTTVIDDDDTVHQYDMQQHMRIRHDTKYYESKSRSNFALDNNSDSSSHQQICASIATTSGIGIPLPNNENEPTDSKKKSKKHKKEKKKKKSSKNSLDFKIPEELPECPSNSSLNFHTSANIVNKAKNNSVSETLISAPASLKPNEFNFIGKFGKEVTVINVDSSSCSNSPKHEFLTSNLPNLSERSASQTLHHNNKNNEKDLQINQTKMGRPTSTMKSNNIDNTSQVRIILKTNCLLYESALSSTI